MQNEWASKRELRSWNQDRRKNDAKYVKYYINVSQKEYEWRRTN